MKLTSMKMSKEEKKEYAEPKSIGECEYPYGLRLCLNEESIKKLGIGELPKVGAKMQIICMVEVCSAGQYESEHGVNRNLDFQITDMGIVEQEKESAAKVLYGVNK